MFYLQMFVIALVIALAIVASNAWFGRRCWKRGYALGYCDGSEAAWKNAGNAIKETKETWRAYADELCDKHRNALEENSREWAAFAKREHERGLGDYEAHGKRQREYGYVAGGEEQYKIGYEDGRNKGLVEGYDRGFAAKIDASIKKPADRKGGVARKVPAKLTKKTAKAKK